MKNVFNTIFETSLRIMLLLSVAPDDGMTLDRISNMDVITIYSKYFGLSDELMHGENEFGLSEFAARREKIQIVLKEMVQDETATVKCTTNGFVYGLSSRGHMIVAEMKTVYALKYILLAKKTVSCFNKMSDAEIIEAIGKVSKNSLRR